jgi:gamma-tubulin complex component 2
MAQDYQTLLSQLENAFNTSPSFSLQKLWFYVHPTVHTLSLIYQLILELATADDPGAELSSSSSSSGGEDEEEAARNEALGLGGASLKAVLSEINKADIAGGMPGGSGIAVKGGEVLAIIYERMQNMSGDPTADAIYGKLLKQAGKPYVEMLKDWVASGRLADPYEEFLVKESKFIDRGILEMDYTDEYWERRYTVCVNISRFWNNEFECCGSCEMVRYLLDHQNGTKQVCHLRVLWGAVYLAEPVYRHC